MIKDPICGMTVDEATALHAERRNPLHHAPCAQARLPRLGIQARLRGHPPRAMRESGGPLSFQHSLAQRHGLEDGAPSAQIRNLKGVAKRTVSQAGTSQIA
jgi:hypothetical protein